MNSERARAADMRAPKRVLLGPKDSLEAAPVKEGPTAEEDGLPGDDPLPGCEEPEPEPEADGDAGRPVGAAAPVDEIPLVVG
jgi:hypothetical protein